MYLENGGSADDRGDDESYGRDHIARDVFSIKAYLITYRNSPLVTVFLIPPRSLESSVSSSLFVHL
jgi:hypothetical protein